MTKRIILGALYGALPVVLLWVLLASTGRADDFQCVSDEGCTAQTGGPENRTVRFKKGDIVSTSSGWIVNPALGWRQVDLANALAGLPEGFEPTSIRIGC